MKRAVAWGYVWGKKEDDDDDAVTFVLLSSMLVLLLHRCLWEEIFVTTR